VSNVGYDTKALLKLIAEIIAKSQTLREAYNSVTRAASVEDVSLLSYDEALALIKAEREDKQQ